MNRTAIAALFLLAAGSLSAQTTVTTDLEWGNRWVDLSGNEAMYRSQIDERDGLLLRNLTFEADSGGEGFHAFDRLRLDAAGIGIGPDSSLRLDVGRSGLYEVRFHWHRADEWSALPTFANPLLERGILGSQHTGDRTRSGFELRLEAMPGWIVSPVVEYRRTTLDGPGTSTVTLGGDEFRLDSSTDVTTDELLAGVGFAAGPVAGEVLYGKRKSDVDERLSLADGASAGNNPGTLLGVPVGADEYLRRSSTEIDTPILHGHVVARLGGSARLVAFYGRSDADSDTKEVESAEGRFVSFAISRFFHGLDETSRTKADALAWNGRVRAEATLAERFDFVLAYGKRHRELDGVALVESLYTGTTNFSGVDPRDVLEELSAETSIERDDATAEITAVAREIGPMTFRAGYSVTDQDLDVVAAPEEIVIPGNQEGSFSRRIDRWTAGATFRAAGLSVSADWAAEEADDPILRTDFTDRDRLRARAAYTAGEFATFALHVDHSALHFLRGAGRSAETTLLGGSAEIRFGDPFTLRLSGSEFTTESFLTYRRPETFAVVPSDHEEDGTDVELGFSSKLFGKVRLDGAYAFVNNDGPFGYRIERGRIVVDVDVTPELSILLEAARDRYEEHPSLAGDFTANRYGAYLRFRY